MTEESQSNPNILDLIRSEHYDLMFDKKYIIISANPATGILYVTERSPFYISGQVRMRGRNGGRYPYHYQEMVDRIFGIENTIEVCAGSIPGRTAKQKDSQSSPSCFTVDINPDTKPDLVADGQKLDMIPNDTFNRWRCDPPYNITTAKEMYGTDLPNTSKLLKEAARICKPGSLMFLLLGPQNIQSCPAGTKRIGYIDITVVPNNEIRCLNIFYKYQDY